MKKQSGFTFIELIISLTILAFISLFVAQSIRSASRNKDKIQKELERDSSVRDALYVMARDIKFAFNYRDINVQLYNEAQKQRRQRAQKKQQKPDEKKKEDEPSAPGATTDNPDNKTENTPFQPAVNLEEKYPLKEEVILTHFQGSSEELHFTTLSNIRSLPNQKISDQAEVGYYLKECRSREDLERRTTCLWRRKADFVDDQITEGGDETPLLEDVTKIKFRYIAPTDLNEPEWRDTWYSGENADDFTRGKFPSAVEISLEVENKSLEKDKPFAMTVVAPLRFPNNAPIETARTNEPNVPGGGIGPPPGGDQ